MDLSFPPPPLDLALLFLLLVLLLPTLDLRDVVVARVLASSRGSPLALVAMVFFECCSRF
jgi:hypothetical protein